MFLSIEVISLNVGSNLSLPLVSIVKEFLFVVEQFLMGFSGKLKVRTLRTQKQGLVNTIRKNMQRSVVQHKSGSHGSKNDLSDEQLHKDNINMQL